MTTTATQLRTTAASALRFTDRAELDGFIRRLRKAARRSARNGGAYTVTQHETLDAAVAGRSTPRKVEIEVHL